MNVNQRSDCPTYDESSSLMHSEYAVSTQNQIYANRIGSMAV